MKNHVPAMKRAEDTSWCYNGGVWGGGHYAIPRVSAFDFGNTGIDQEAHRSSSIWALILAFGFFFFLCRIWASFCSSELSGNLVKHFEKMKFI